MLILSAFVVAFAFPFTQGGSDANMSIATQVIIFAATAMGLNIVVGLAGLLDLGYIAFLGAGAFTAAILSQLGVLDGRLAPAVHRRGADQRLRSRRRSACSSDRRRCGSSGDYLAIVTLAFGEIFRISMNNLDGSDGPNLTNGSDGIPAIPDLVCSASTSANRTCCSASRWAGSRTTTSCCCCVLGLVILVFVRLNNSRIGRGWVAIREDEKAAEAMGVNIFGLKLLAFAGGAFLAGVAGSVKAHVDVSVTPDQYVFLESAFLLAAIVLGGMGTVLGVLVGATILKLMPEKLRFVNEYRLLIFGLLLVLMMRFRPEGLVPNQRRQLEFHEEDEELAERIEEEIEETGIDRGGGDTVTATNARARTSRRRRARRSWQAENVTMRFGGLTAVDEVNFTGQPRRDRRADRPQRSRQDDVLQLPDRAVPADQRRVVFDGAVLPPKPRKVVLGRHGPDVPEHPAVRQHDRAGERDGRPLLPDHHRPVHLDPPRPEVPPGRGGGPRQRSQELLDFVGLGQTTDHLARNLPYGDQRRLEIARALATDPKLILLDEPTAGMNPQETRQAEDLIFRIRDLGLAVVVIEHDMRFIFNLCDRVLCLVQGKALIEGTPTEVQSDPRVIEAYIGTGPEDAGDAGARAAASRRRVAMLEVKDLEVAYGQIRAVKGITFTVEEGQVVTLIGTNGAGKTTTLRTISGLLKPEAGEIWFQGKRIDATPAHEIRSSAWRTRRRAGGSSRG